MSFSPMFTDSSNPPSPIACLILCKVTFLDTQNILHGFSTPGPMCSMKIISHSGRYPSLSIRTFLRKNQDPDWPHVNLYGGKEAYYKMGISQN